MLASNPGPHRHRICDRREEGLVKPPFCFGSLPTIVGKISHSNYLAKSAVFKSVFDSQKRRGARPAQAQLVKVQTQGKSQLGARRRLNMVKKGAEERTKTFWFRNRWLFGPPKFTVRSERNVFPSSFSCFLFFLSHVYLLGKTPVSALREQHQFRAQGASGKRGPDLLALFERRDCISSQNNASAPKGVPCRRRALFVIMATKLSKPSRRSFPCKMLVWSSSSTWQGEVSSL